MPSELVYRLAGEDDLPALLSLVHSAYRGEASRAGWTTEADLLDGQRIDLEGLRALIQRPASRIVLASVSAGTGTGLTNHDDQLVACAHIERLPDSGYFGMFAVAPARQAGGIGRQVLAECERQLRDDLGCKQIEMTVLWQRTELIAWYQRRGYFLSDERRPFPVTDPRFGLPRRSDLYFLVLRKQLR
jgi:GNAT superfamily N-acetyltransferase